VLQIMPDRTQVSKVDVDFSDDEGPIAQEARAYSNVRQLDKSSLLSRLKPL
jgi:hypothetical protein